MNLKVARYVLDTNVALYLLGGRLLNPLPSGEFYLSIISEMELLSYPSLTESEALRIRRLLEQASIVGLDEALKNAVIELRKKYRLKMMNAIICATALSLNSVSFSNDAQLSRVVEISVESVLIHSQQNPPLLCPKNDCFSSAGNIKLTED